MIQRKKRSRLPELASFLLAIGELDQGRQDLFDDPTPLILVIREDLGGRSQL